MAADRRDARPLRLSRAGLLVGLCVALSAITAQAAATDVAQIRTQLAVEYSWAGDLKVALDSADQAITADQGYVPGHLMRANVLQQLKVDGEAERSYQRALSLAPGNPEANNNYGWFLCLHGQENESLAYFRRALTDPLYESPQTARLNLGVCLAKLGRKAEANDQFLAALQAAPGFAGALTELARLYLEQGNGKLAGLYLDRLARSGVPLSADALLLGVGIARLNGDSDRERQFIGQLTSRFPDARETQQLFSGL